MRSLTTSSHSPNGRPSPQERAARKLLNLAELRTEKDRRDITHWAERSFYIEDTEAPIVLERHQKAVLRYALRRKPDSRLPYTTIIWSTPKKGGKTTIAGAVTRWAAETWGRYGEILCVGNDADQAKERAFKKLRISIEMTPGYNRSREELPDQWRLQTKWAKCLSTGSEVKAIATDYKGEAGANPILVVWTELWGFTLNADLRFWAEMAPSPTRPDSVQWIETYAGYEGESELLWNLYQSVVLNGRQLTAGEIGDLSAFEESPNPDSLVPCYVDEPARIFAYWDEGTQGRRMPWQKGEHGRQYYASEEARQTPGQMTRIHSNEWVSAESSFIQIEWWDVLKEPLPLKLGEDTPLILALDAGVSGDCFAVVGVSRDPRHLEPPGVAVRMVRKWDPPLGGVIDFKGPEEYVRKLCAEYNVIEVAYDQYQLHQFATRLRTDGVAWFKEFHQGEDRLVADKGLYDLIVNRRIRHDGNPDLRDHLTNANAKQSPHEESKLRIVKKAESRKVDLAVALSMASHECLRLNLEG